MIKRIITPLTFILFAITCSSLAWYYYKGHSIVPMYQKNLIDMAQKRTNEIATYLNQQETYAITLSQEQTVINILKTAVQNVTQTSEEEHHLSEIISSNKDTMNFKNILLINTAGIIVFSTTKNKLIGTNLNKHTQSSLGKSYERATMTLTNDFSHFNFNELLEEPALFISVPIMHNKKFIGVMAYQLNEEKIYLITHQYIGLQKTGEVVLAEKEDESLVFIARTRNEPDITFKKIPLFSDQAPAIEQSVLGKEGAGIAKDYRGKKIVGAWNFISKLDWGMIVKIDLSEVLESTNILYNIFLLILLFFLISLFCNIYCFWPQIRKKIITINSLPPCNKIPAIFKSPLFILLLITSSLAIKNIIQCERKKLSTITKAQQKAIRNCSKNADIIDSILSKITFVGTSITNDLHTHYLKKDEISTRIKRDLAENDSILNITVLFMPYAYNNTTEIHKDSVSQPTFQATEPTSAERATIFTKKWYTKALEEKEVWIINRTEINNNDFPTATYARTFFNEKNEPQGVVAITCSLAQIIRIAEHNTMGQTGYSIIMTEDGSLIFHPISTLIETGTSLLQYAESKGNEELASIAQKTLKGKPFIASYVSKGAHTKQWIYTHPIATNNWIVGSIFPEDEIGLSSLVIRHYYFFVLIWITIALLLLCALLCQCKIISLTQYSIIATIILTLALLITWKLIQSTTIINRETRTIITDQSSLNKFLNNLYDEAERKHEQPPINIPCGILLYSLSLTEQDSISVSGYLWNKYDMITQKNIDRGMDLPQARRLIYGKPLISQADNIETSTWSIQGVMFQEQEHSEYPFDQQHIRIILEHRDIEKNIILTPDLSAYKTISPEATPGLDREFSLSGFTIEQAFFEYHKIDPNTNFGFKEYGKVTDNFQLIYNAIMNRNLLNPFVLYVLPLLVILFALFSTLLIVKITTDPLSMLGGYTALFFSLIMLQRSLREQHPAGTTLYLEYAFFYASITIILLTLHTIILFYYKKWQTYQHHSLYFLRILFWPFQLISWLITTLIVFY